MLDHYRTFAHYNAWANDRLYTAAEALGHEAFHRPAPAAYFESLCGTLNHILVGDRLWMDRIEEVESEPLRLDTVLHEDFEELRTARDAQDRRILRAMDGLTDARLGGVLSYQTVAGEAHMTPMALVLAHLFNHQTHHRGQAHAIIKSAGAEPPSLDLIYYLREAA